ncbi:MAG: hypothetical protein A3H64_00985 [Candidatus Ryanbacteria bacterium RIFCSPLOWO2_02_FULL_45_11c]|uniref:Peptidase A2 domain-containing protein n=1 Tax=Candidatus Ryanbacteria bacterium RIFCSPLOWO2_02_FULL_45_11c TaxID=1802128 RepID=A0A1G2H1W6_9BACT|nr:MAG: hypothetical protein A3H64_00985 [Candidatus Ryanbacteria bacterium RIFCSPLOWO2_02_FULL_45_11c]
MFKSCRFPYGIKMEESGALSVFPAVTIILRTKKGEELSVVALIDSGATISAMPKNIAPLLGIDCKKGKVLRIYGVGNKRVTAWQHDVTIELGGNTMILPVAFLDDNAIPRILGRGGLFEKFIIIFDEQKQRTLFLEPKARSRIDSLIP